ncbi:Uncharacterised protein [Serratia odorifera]|uniref:Uncharacterized protein n=1 Tax=Serratia odorifera TaxID=618 RepID=A0A3S5D7U5_SEROD|nr:hypothetical protein [Serratia odorifera]VDZ62121.1 Uncharacterised protein [Serratia odorifera]
MEIDDERAMFIANEIGAAVIGVNRKWHGSEPPKHRGFVGNTLHKGVLRDAATLVREKNNE